MKTKTLKSYLVKAEKQGWAIGQFNFSAYTQLVAIVEAAKELKSPVILGTSEGESKFFGLKQAVAVKKAFQEETGLPLFLNLDHGKSFKYVKEAIDAGYDMVHFDGSKLPLKENIKITQKVVKYAKKKGVLVEGELGIMITDSSKVYFKKLKTEEKDLTNPVESAKYIDKTKVDLLAISIGTFHGIEASGINPHLKLDRLKEIKKKTGKIPLVLHGGSGTPENDVKKSIKLGITKININTELRLAYSGNLRRALGDADKTTPYKYLPEVGGSVQRVVEKKIKLFGSENKI